MIRIYIHILRSYIKILIITFISISPLLSANKNSSLIYEIIKTNTGIKSLVADIVQYIYTKEHSREIFKGKYIADDSGRFRIDYSSPSKQIVLNDGSALYWYYPDNNIVYTSGREKSLQKGLKINPLQEFHHKEFNNQFKIDYLGKHLYGFFILAHQFVIKDTKNNLTFDIWVHAKKKVLLAKIITDGAGIEIIKEIYSNYEKIKNVYFPKRIDVYARTDTGIIRNTTEYYNIRLNYSIPENLFIIKFPPDVKRKYLN